MATVLGGGLILLGLAFFGAMLLFSYFWLPKGGRAALTIMCLLAGVSAGFTGLSILTGGGGWLDSGVWGAVFVVSMTCGLWTFNLTMLVEIVRHRAVGQTDNLKTPARPEKTEDEDE